MAEKRRPSTNHPGAVTLHPRMWGRIFEYLDDSLDDLARVKAAGCVLVAWRQLDIEQDELGFVDGENVVLYSSDDELKRKLKWLDDNPEAAKRIARAGQEKVTGCHTWAHRAEAISGLVAPDIVPAPRPGWVDRIRISGA